MPSREAEERYGRWTYGDAGDRYPVRRGDVWQAGRHLLCCGDLEAYDWDRFQRLADVGRAELCYVDPPWNAGNAASFRTKAAVPRKVDFPAFLTAVVAAAVSGAEQTMMEMGEQEIQRLFAVLDASFQRVYRVWRITYYGSHPCRLVYFGSALGPLIEPAPGLMDGLDDERTPHVACAALAARRGPDALVIDPCCGRGLTAVAAQEAGIRFAGMELHPRRMAVALEKLGSLGCAVQRVGSITPQGDAQ